MSQGDYTETDSFKALPRETQWRYRCMLLTKDVEIERDRSKKWRELAGRYDDIRDWLRLCHDTPQGHAEFYKECCLTIFGTYRDESGDDDD